MKDEPGGIAVEEFVGLKPKIYAFLVDNNEHEKVKCPNKNVVVTISHNEYKDALLSNECVRHSLPCFDDIIYIQNNGYDRLDLGYHSDKQTGILITI